MTVYGAVPSGGVRAPSALHRALRPSAHLFSCSWGGDEWRDSAIQSIAINRGSASSDPGITVPTAEIALSSDVDIAYTQEMTIDATLPPVLKDAAESGELKWLGRRFTGRVELQDRTVKETNGVRDTKVTSRVYGVGNIKEMTTDSTTIPADPNNSLKTIWERLKFYEYREHRWMAGDLDGAALKTEESAMYKKSEVVKWFPDIEMFILNTRYGDLQLKSIPHRILEASEIIGANPPVIETWQASAGLQQKQQTPLNPTVTLPSALVYDTKTRSWPNITYSPDWREYTAYGVVQPMTTETADWGGIGFPDPSTQKVSHIRQSMRAHVARQLGVGWRIPEVTFDLVKLLRPHAWTPEQLAVNARLAVLLLMLEEGGPFHLGSSFGRYSGVHFATGIKETITPKAWTFTLSLAPREQITGELTEPRTWNKAPFPWNSSNMTTWSS